MKRNSKRITKSTLIYEESSHDEQPQRQPIAETEHDQHQQTVMQEVTGVNEPPATHFLPETTKTSNF